jgi:hypothetical protein
MEGENVSKSIFLRELRFYAFIINNFINNFWKISTMKTTFLTMTTRCLVYTLRRVWKFTRIRLLFVDYSATILPRATINLKITLRPIGWLPKLWNCPSIMKLNTETGRYNNSWSGQKFTALDIISRRNTMKWDMLSLINSDI